MSIDDSLDAFAAIFTCSFCKQSKEQLTIWKHTDHYYCGLKFPGITLYLCFRGCQNFPEPFKATGCNKRDHWYRVDRWQGVKRPTPRYAGGRDWRAYEERVPDRNKSEHYAAMQDSQR